MSNSIANLSKYTFEQCSSLEMKCLQQWGEPITSVVKKQKCLLFLLLPVLSIGVLMSFYIFYCILMAQEEKSQHWSCGARRWQDSCSSSWGDFTRESHTNSFPYSPPFACFLKSCMLTWTEPACEQFGGLYLGAERRVQFCLRSCCVSNPLGYFPLLENQLIWTVGSPEVLWKDVFL